MDIIIKSAFRHHMKLAGIINDIIRERGGDKNNKKKRLLVGILDNSGTYCVKLKVHKYVIKYLCDDHIITKEGDGEYRFRLDDDEEED